MPSTRPAIVRCRFATQRVAGTTSDEDADADPDDDQHAADDPEDEQHDQQDRRGSSWATAYPVSSRRPGGAVVGVVLTGPSSPAGPTSRSGAGTTTRPGPSAPDARRPPIRGWKHHPHRIPGETAMGNPLTAVPMKAARWSAEHPWRAILGWIAFVAVAVGLAVAIPTHEATDADYRIGESGRADAMVAQAHLEQPDTENILITAGAGHARRGAGRAGGRRRGRRREGRRRRRRASPSRSGTRTVRRCSSRSSSTPGADDADAVQAVTDDVQQDFPDLQVRAGRRPLGRRGHQRPGRRGPRRPPRRSACRSRCC